MSSSNLCAHRHSLSLDPSSYPVPLSSSLSTSPPKCRWQVRGRRHSLDERNKRVRTMRLEPPPNANYTLEDVAWDEESLRLLLQRMLSRFGVGPSDLMRAWDKSGDGLLDRREFSREIQAFFKGEYDALWEREVSATASQHQSAGLTANARC